MPLLQQEEAHSYLIKKDFTLYTPNLSPTPEHEIHPVAYDLSSIPLEASNEPLSEEAEPADKPDDLWERIRNGLGLPRPDRRKIASKVNWFGLSQAYFDQVIARARPYLHHIVEEVERREMPMDIALLPFIESAFEPDARSSRGAVGIWQFTASTGKLFGLKQNAWYDGRRDIMASTQAALDYLGTLHDKFDGDWLLALAAYNCGEKTVEAAINRNRETGKATDFWSLNLPPQTRAYVPKLLAVSSIIATPSKFNVTLDPIPNEPYLTEVEVGGQLSLSQAAKLAGISIDKLRALNPGFKGSITDPRGLHKLWVPIDKAERLQRQLDRWPTVQRVRLSGYKDHDNKDASKTDARVTPPRSNKLTSMRIRTDRNPISSRSTEAKEPELQDVSEEGA